jgi:hypothetical protein
VLHGDTVQIEAAKDGKLSFVVPDREKSALETAV